MIRLDQGIAHLEQHCPVDEAETLLQAIQSGAAVAIDLSACRSLHTAMLQVLLATRVPMVAPPAEAELAGLLAGLPPPPTQDRPRRRSRAARRTAGAAS